MTQASRDRHDQRRGPAADFVRPRSGTACVEIEVDAKLAEPGDLGASSRIGHAMDHAERELPR